MENELSGVSHQNQSSKSLIFLFPLGTVVSIYEFSPETYGDCVFPQSAVEKSGVSPRNSPLTTAIALVVQLVHAATDCLFQPYAYPTGEISDETTCFLTVL